MAFYLFQGRYSADAVKAMVANPQDREAASRALIEGLGGKLHCFYLSFGTYDFAAIIEGDNAAMTAGSLTVSAAGAVTGAVTTPLITSAEGIAAMASANQAMAAYSPPG